MNIFWGILSYAITLIVGITFGMIEGYNCGKQNMLDELRKKERKEKNR